MVLVTRRRPPGRRSRNRCGFAAHHVTNEHRVFHKDGRVPQLIAKLLRDVEAVREVATVQEYHEVVVGTLLRLVLVLVDQSGLMRRNEVDVVFEDAHGGVSCRLALTFDDITVCHEVRDAFHVPLLGSNVGPEGVLNREVLGKLLVDSLWLLED